jgi:hypothetical protein
LPHPNDVVARVRLQELDRQRGVLFEKRGRTVRIRHYGAPGLVGRDGVAAANDLLDRDHSGDAVRVCEGDAPRYCVEKSGLRGGRRACQEE